MGKIGFMVKILFSGKDACLWHWKSRVNMVFARLSSGLFPLNTNNFSAYVSNMLVRCYWLEINLQRIMHILVLNLEYPA